MGAALVPSRGLWVQSGCPLEACASKCVGPCSGPVSRVAAPLGGDSGDLGVELGVSRFYRATVVARVPRCLCGEGVIYLGNEDLGTRVCLPWAWSGSESEGDALQVGVSAGSQSRPQTLVTHPSLCPQVSSPLPAAGSWPMRRTPTCLASCTRTSL